MGLWCPSVSRGAGKGLSRSSSVVEPRFASPDFLRFCASSDIATGLRMVNFVYLTGGWLTQLTPTMEDETELEPVGEGRLGAELELVGDWEELTDPDDELCCLFIRMFSTVKLEMCLLLEGGLGEEVAMM